MRRLTRRDANSDTTLHFEGTVPRGLTGYDGCNFIASIRGRALSGTINVYDIHPEQWSSYFADLVQC